MDTENDKDNSDVTSYHILTTDDIEVSERLESEDNLTTDHTVYADCNQLAGPSVVAMIMSKPEYSFLIRYYSLLYQSLIPNCKLTISTLRHHIAISDNMEQYIIGAANRRTSCQRLINFLLTCLDSKKDYMQFCHHINIITVINDLSDRLIAEFHTNGNWVHEMPIHLRKSLDKLQHNTNYIHKQELQTIGAANITAGELSALSNYLIDGASNGRADKCSISVYYNQNRKRRFVVFQETTSDKQCIASTALPSSSSEDTSDYYLPQRSMITPEIKSPNVECAQQNILSQASTDITHVNDTHITFSSSPTAVSSTVSCSTPSDIVITTISGQAASTIAVSANVESDSITEECVLPQNLIANEDFTELKAHYHTILHLMPDNYEPTVSILVNYISDAQICAILSSSNTATANKLILDCLIERMSCRGELLDLCDQLESITASHDLKVVINEIRLGVQQSIQCPISTLATTTTTTTITTTTIISAISTISTTSVTQSLSAGNQPCEFMSPNMNDPMLQMGFSCNISSKNFSITNMQKKLKYEERRLQKGFKYFKPPPLPSYHVNRKILLEEIANKLLQATNDPSKYETTVTITGVGGFGKTTAVISLCYYPTVQNQFTDGFIFIELGPQAIDPSIKLRAMYNLLTDKQCDINVVEQKINQLTSDYYRNLLVIIDDVWHAEDAQPIIKAFSNCKTVLTTRMNNIEQYIPTNKSVTIGPMTQSEAISLLTNGIFDVSQLSQEDMSLLDELAQDVHLWPLLISLIRGQIVHNLKQQLSHHKALKNVQANLQRKGLTAFDKNILDLENIKKSRNLAIKVCIEITLELLTKSVSDRIKSLIVWTGIGTSFQSAALQNLWFISDQEAEDTINTLWAYGLVQFANVTISSNNNMQQSVEVHAIISQYIIENMDSQEVVDLSPCQELKGRCLCEKLVLSFQESYGIHNASSLTSMDFMLKYKLSEVENIWLPYYLKTINMYTVTDPHVVMILLQWINDVLIAPPYTQNFLQFLDENMNLLAECKQILKNAHKFCRVFNQNVQRIFYECKYDKLIETVKEYIKNYPLCNVVQKVLNIIKKIIPHCDDRLLHSMMMKQELLNLVTPNYHEITTFALPNIKLYVKLHEQITNSLLHGSPDIESTYNYICSGKFNEEVHFITYKRNIKLKEVAPTVVAREIAEY